MENLDINHHQNRPHLYPQAQVAVVEVEGVELVGVAPAVVVEERLKRHSRLQVIDTDPRVD